MTRFSTLPDQHQSTASKVWALAAAQRIPELLRGGQCSGGRWDVTLKDGRTFLGCGARQDGEFLVLTLLSSPHGSVELVTTYANVAEADEASPYGSARKLPGEPPPEVIPEDLTPVVVDATVGEE